MMSNQYVSQGQFMQPEQPNFQQGNQLMSHGLPSESMNGQPYTAAPAAPVDMAAGNPQNYMSPRTAAAPANFVQPAQYNPQDYSQHPATRPSATSQASLEQRVTHMENWMETVRGLIARQRELMEELRGGKIATSSPSSIAPPTKVEEKKGRSSMTYTNYVKVQALVVAGKVDKDISQELGIPYTTVRKYKAWSAEEVEAAKRKEVTGNAGSRTNVQTQWTQDGTVQAPTPQDAVAGNILEAAKNVNDGQLSETAITDGINTENCQATCESENETAVFERPKPFPLSPYAIGNSEQSMQPRMIGHQISYLTNPPTMVPVFEGQPYNPQSFVPYQPPAPTEPKRIN